MTPAEEEKMGKHPEFSLFRELIKIPNQLWNNPNPNHY